MSDCDDPTGVVAHSCTFKGSCHLGKSAVDLTTVDCKCNLVTPQFSSSWQMAVAEGFLLCPANGYQEVGNGYLNVSQLNSAPVVKNIQVFHHVCDIELLCNPF